MRFPSIPTIIRAFHTVSNTTSAFIRANPARTFSTPQRTIHRSMPNIPFFGALFGSSSMADNTQYPVQKAEGEWQAQLSPGMSAYTRHINAI
jgi:peptide-methionine (R)-S-oxide reductase